MNDKNLREVMASWTGTLPEYIPDYAIKEVKNAIRMDQQDAEAVIRMQKHAERIQAHTGKPEEEAILFSSLQSIK
jgi:hypothetical protein